MTHGEKTRLKILNAGVKLWRTDASKVSARNIGRQIDLTHGAVLYHFENADDMIKHIATHAVMTGDSKVIAQLIATNHCSVASMSKRRRNIHLNAVCV